MTIASLMGHDFRGNPAAENCCLVCEQPKELHARVVVDIVDSIDGWSEARLACGHSFNFIMAIGIGVPSPCADCVENYALSQRKAS